MENIQLATLRIRSSSKQIVLPWAHLCPPFFRRLPFIVDKNGLPFRVCMVTMDPGIFYCSYLSSRIKDIIQILLLPITCSYNEQLLLLRWLLFLSHSGLRNERKMHYSASSWKRTCERVTHTVYLFTYDESQPRAISLQFPLQSLSLAIHEEVMNSRIMSLVTLFLLLK